MYNVFRIIMYKLFTLSTGTNVIVIRKLKNKCFKKKLLALPVVNNYRVKSYTVFFGFPFHAYILPILPQAAQPGCLFSFTSRNTSINAPP